MALWLLCVAPAWAGGLRLDYLPTLLYNDDVTNVHLTVTAERQANDKFKVEASAVGGGYLWHRTVEPDEEGVIRLVIPPGDRTDMHACRLQWVRDGKATETFQFRIVRAVGGLPPLTAAGNYILDEKARPCVIIVEHRVREHDRTWLPVRVVHDLIKEDPAPPGALVLTDLPLVAPKGSRAKFLEASPGQLPSRPIYEAIAALSRVEKVRPKDSYTLFVGSRDVPIATEPRELRIGLEVLIQGLQAQGAQDLRVVLPIASQQYKDRLEVYRKQYERVSYIYRVRQVVKIERHFATDIWRNRWFSPILWRFPSGEVLKQMANVLATEGLKGN